MDFHEYELNMPMYGNGYEFQISWSSVNFHVNEFESDELYELMTSHDHEPGTLWIFNDMNQKFHG